MGACAITVLAGARILEMTETPMVHATRGIVAGASVMFWAFATWLIPALIAAGWWRHRTHRVPLNYEATLWSIIFPFGKIGRASCRERVGIAGVGGGGKTQTREGAGARRSGWMRVRSVA